MNKQAFTGKPVGIVTALIVAATPVTVSAGSYGSAGVSDASVGQTASQDTVWCERVEARVPRNLAARMNCGDSTVPASSAVAGERITNGRRTIKDFFTVRRNGPVEDPKERDDPDRRVVRIIDRGPDGEGGGGEGPGGGFVSKSDRLNELGITSDNLANQSPDLTTEMGDFNDIAGPDGDWSGFSPTTEIVN